MTDDLHSLPAVQVDLALENAGVKQSIHTDYDALVWTDITAYVRASDGVTFSRGRAQAGQGAVAGQLTVTVDNTDGRFTPAMTGGAYGRITTMMPIRVVGYTVAGVVGSGPFGTDYGVEFDRAASDGIDLWTGFVTDVSWQLVAGQPVVQFQAIDIVGAAARMRCQPWLTGRVLTQATDIANYWPLTDGAGVTAAASGLIPAGSSATVTGTLGDVTFGVSSDLSPDSDTVAAFTPSGANYKTVVGSITAPTSGDLAVSGWIRLTARPGGLVTLTSGASTALAVAVNASGQVTVTEGGVTGTYGSAADVAVATWTHLYVERDHSDTGTFAGRFRVWVNGVEKSKTSGGASVSAVTATTTTVTIGHATDPLNGQAGHVVVFTTVTAAATRAQLLADKGTSTPTADARYLQLPYVMPRQVATLGSWLVSDATASVTMSAQTTKGKTLLEVCDEIAATERGQMVAAGSGKLTLVSAGSRVPGTTPAVTLTAGDDVLAFDGAFGIDDAESYDTAQVTIEPSGLVYSASSSDTDPGLQNYSATIWTTDGNQAQGIANATVTALSDVPRSPRLTVSMDWLTYAGKSDAMLAVELGDLIAVTDLPATAPATYLNLTVEAMEHAISAAGWTVTVDTGTAGGWKLGDPVLSVLGTTTILQL